MRTPFLVALAIAMLICAHPMSFAEVGPSDSTSFVEVDGAKLFVRSVGAGTPIVVLHGGPGMSHDYLASHLIALLADDYRLVFYDQRASGRSTGVADTARLTMAQFVEDLDRLRLELGLERMNVLGHSFGGLLAMCYATEHPNAVGSLVLVDTSPASWALNFPHFRRTVAERLSESDRREMAAITAGAGARGDPQAMTKYFKTMFRAFFHQPALSEQLVLGIDEQWLENNAVTSSHVWASLGEYDIHEHLPRIQAPTLILHGTFSVISMEGAEAIATRIPRSRLIALRDVGHFPHIEAPMAFATAVKAFVWPD